VSLPVAIDPVDARRIAVAAALLREPRLPATAGDIVEVARHFGGIQIDPTRTVERTQYLVLWSRLGNYDRALLEQLLNERRLFEWKAFIVTPDLLPEILYYARRWPAWEGNWSQRVRDFLTANDAFRQSILDQLRAQGPLQSRDIDDSKLVKGWESTGWTHGKNTSQMLEFMSSRAEVFVAGRVGQERMWDIAERVLPRDAPRDKLTDDEYEERRVMRGLARFGVATFKEIRDRAYGLSIPAAKALLARLTEDGRLTPVSLPTESGTTPAWALPERSDGDGGAALTTLLSPFDPLVYDRARTKRLFGFDYKLEMYVPKSERQFGHFVLPILHDDQLVGRLDSERDRKTNELQLKRLHWEHGTPEPSVRGAVDDAIDDLATFVRAG